LCYNISSLLLWYFFFEYSGAVFELPVWRLTHNLTQNRKNPHEINGAGSTKGG